VISEAKLPTCPDAIAAWLGKKAINLARVGLETGPMAVWLWNELHARALPVICLDARHAHAALKVRPNKTDRNDAAGLAQIVRTGWFKQVQIKTRASYEVRSLLAGRDALVQIRVKLENEIRGLLRTFGVLFGKAVGGFSRRADELVVGELEASPPCDSSSKRCCEPEPPSSIRSRCSIGSSRRSPRCTLLRACL